MPYQVLRPIPADDGVIPSGSIVDAEDWRNLRTLISGRYLSATPVAKSAKEATAKVGAPTKPRKKPSTSTPQE